MAREINQPTGTTAWENNAGTKAAGAQLSPIVNEIGGDAVQAGLKRLNALWSGQRNAVAASLLGERRKHVSALTVLVKAELKQRCREQGLHRLQGLLLSGIWPPGPFLKVKAHRAVEQANSFKVQIELEGGARLTHDPILPNTTLTAQKRTSST